MLKEYASYFVSYLLSNLKNKENIIRIILYGSVAKKDAREESDIDIFIEVKNKTISFIKEVKSIEKKFYNGRESTLYKAKGVANEFSIKIGKLSEWKELYQSVASTGIILYGPYEAKELPSGVKHFIILFWDEIGLNRGSFLNKIYGFKTKEKYYEGLLEKFDGKKLGKSCIMLPIQYKNEIFELLKKHKVRAKTLEVYK